MPGQPKLEFLIAGAQKAGTSTLATVLARHPDVFFTRPKEVPFFVCDHVYDRGARWFEQHFAQARPDQRIGSASVHVAASARAVARLHRYNPSTKLLLMLRNPADRAYSAFWYARRLGLETAASFEEAIALNQGDENEDPSNQERSYINNGRYVLHIRNLLEWFPQDQISVLLFEEFIEEPFAVLSRIGDFLGLRAEPWQVQLDRVNGAARARSSSVARFLHSRSLFKDVGRKFLPQELCYKLRQIADEVNTVPHAYPDLSLDTRSALNEKFRDDNRSLAELLSIDVDVWR